VTGVLRGAERSVLGIRLRDGGEVAAPFVVDASGSASVLARALGLKRRESIRTVALSEYFADSAATTDTLFEMLEDGWVWSVLLADGTRNVTVGLDAAELKGGGADPEAIHRARLARSKLIGPLLEGARPVSPIAAHDATWFFSDRYAGSGFLLAGDAASFIDPLTSQGVYKAMSSGIHAAAVINTILRRPASADVAVAYYEEREQGAYASYTEAALAIYRTSPYLDLPFWRTVLSRNSGQAGDLKASCVSVYSRQFTADRADPEHFPRLSTVNCRPHDPTHLSGRRSV
jgi:flavin-dependent dehydrogenase